MQKLLPQFDAAIKHRRIPDASSRHQSKQKESYELTPRRNCERHSHAGGFHKAAKRAG